MCDQSHISVRCLVMCDQSYISVRCLVICDQSHVNIWNHVICGESCAHCWLAISCAEPACQHTCRQSRGQSFAGTLQVEGAFRRGKPYLGHPDPANKLCDHSTRRVVRRHWTRIAFLVQFCFWVRALCTLLAHERVDSWCSQLAGTSSVLFYTTFWVPLFKFGCEELAAWKACLRYWQRASTLNV